MSEVQTQEAVDERRAHLPLYDETNKLKLGTFATNASHAMSMSEAPTSYEVSWDHTLSLARQCDAMGLDMLIPIGRWRGFGGATNYNGESFETYTWAAGLAQATERIMVFATSHVPTIHPIVAAKQATTVDHISGGRFGLNIVMGWFGPEMEMFGSQQREHDERFRVGEEWLGVIKKLWTEEDPFSFEGDFFTVNDAEAWPKPIQKPHPMIMNAGASSASRDFAARNADINFVIIDDAESGAELVRDVQRYAFEEYGRRPLMFSGAYVVCRDTEKEAQDDFRAILDAGDRLAAQNLMEAAGIPGGSFDTALRKATEDRFIVGWGTPAIVGTPEQVAQRFLEIHQAGITGLTLGFLDYAAELDYFDRNVMPLLRQAGLRA
jgi:alkanesulfonate monooxygenase SsuD/methylene tetrahydromethanopterin reductase-like flavin-dependent oxidoreductase (luciferase family)